MVNANKKLQSDVALKLAKAADKLYSMKGKRVSVLDLGNENHSDEEILALMLGPTGNLRAPTVVAGKTLLVGFEANTYQSVFE